MIASVLLTLTDIANSYVLVTYDIRAYLNINFSSTKWTWPQGSRRRGKSLVYVHHSHATSSFTIVL